MLFCVVDKSLGEGHSFVDGMLRGALRSFFPEIMIVYGKRAVGGECSMWDSRCIEAPFSRSGFGRVGIALFSVWVFFKRIGRGSHTVFIRNDVVTLTLFVLLKRLSGVRFRLLFQNSFPHERYSSSRLGRGVATLLMKFSVSGCDRVIVVDGNAIPRIRAYSSCVPIGVIPLCCDFPAGEVSKKLRHEGEVIFLYAGTFSRLRKLDVLIRAFYAVRSRGGFRLVLIGGGIEELAVDKVMMDICNIMIREGSLIMPGRLARDEVARFMAEADVGLNLIPPLDVYMESSSTKLGEYLSQGLPVISSIGVPYHHKIHGYADVGWLVQFSESAIEDLILKIIEGGHEGLRCFHERCIKLVEDHLRYRLYTSEFVGEIPHV